MSVPVSATAALPRARLLGALAVIAGAMLFASKGIFAKLLYARGVGFEALSTIRAVLAIPLFYWFAVMREGNAGVLGTPRPAIRAAAIGGFLCYYVGTLTDFYALTLIDASLERVLIFSYPAMVVLLGTALGRGWPSGRVLLAVLITYSGIFLTMGGFELELLRANYVGALFVLVSAVTFAVYFLVGERYTREIGSARFTFFAMTSAALALVVHYAARRPLSELAAFGLEVWLLLAAVAVLCLFLPALLIAEGLRRIGAERGAIVSTVGPPTTIVLAWLLLGESMSVGQLFGAALIVIGILVLELSRLRR